MTIGLLCSGNLGFSVLRSLLLQRCVKFVFTDSKSKEIHEFCLEKSIPVFFGNPRGGKASGFIEKFNLRVEPVDIVISANYLFIVEEDVINLSKKMSFNVHGALLPKYRGRTPHVWSIINNEKYTGVTAHLIDNGCDTGDIIEQISIKIEDNDTGGSLLEKYSESYIPLIEKVLTRVEKGEIVLRKQNDREASYFGRRSPSDGLINWNWQKERIRNWVRAQAFPYPGAFTYLVHEKIIIDEIVYSNHGYTQEQENGSILSIDPIIVKTPNGAIEVSKFREFDTSKLEIGKILTYEYR